MKILHRPAIAAVLLALLCIGVQAGDFATLNLIGFSKDGKYLAFEEYGTQDGSGFPYSNIYFVDVAKNTFAANAVKVRIERETATEALARSRAKLGAAAALRRLRIVDRNVGTLVVTRLLTDISAYGHRSDDEPRKINFAEIVASMYRKGNFDLTLRPSEIKLKECEYTDQPVRKFELTVKDNDTGKTIVLQKDATVPPSRFCPMSYEIQYVYLYEDNIAVFLNSYIVGFEGPDMRYLVVTGKFR